MITASDPEYIKAMAEMGDPIAESALRKPPVACFARLVAARARRRPSAELRLQACCTGCCTHVPEEVWIALDRAHPHFPLEGPGNRQALAVLIAPLLATQDWRFCRCYLSGRPEHRFISRLVDTVAANAAAELLAAGGAR